MNLFSLHNISKTYEETLLFEGVSYGMEEGERVGVIGRNGAGKSTLLKIIAGIVPPDSGTVSMNKSVRTEFLDQLPTFGDHRSVITAVMDGKPELYKLLKRHEELCNQDNAGEELQIVSSKIEEQRGWNLENEAQRLIDKLGVADIHADVTALSGGQKKRVALARALLSAPDLLILDEPTNHLDTSTVQWLQDEIQVRIKSVLFITHDRYFLDSVSTKIIELDKNKLFAFPGNLEKYLERKELMIESDNSAAQHLRNKIRNELAWLQKGAKARRTKQQSRINWIEKMKAEPPQTEQRDILIEVGNVFLGGRVVDAYNIQAHAGDKLLFKGFTYNAIPGDKIGIIGPNGCGKTTLLNILAGLKESETGTVKVGEKVTIGYFRQILSHVAPTQTVIGAVREVAEYIDAGVGRERYISARELLERFQFPPNRHSSRIETLSGGELRRLELCRILMSNPNVLFLDEPTNDFDLATKSALEDYLQNFKGVLIAVSHDRSFLDKVVEYIYAFEPGGIIKQYPGNYTSYLEAMERKSQSNEKIPAPVSNEESKPTQQKNKGDKKGLSYKEQRELESIEKSMAELEEKKLDIEKKIQQTDGSDYKQITAWSTELSTLESSLEEQLTRWLELEEKKG